MNAAEGVLKFACKILNALWADDAFLVACLEIRRVRKQRLGRKEDFRETARVLGDLVKGGLWGVPAARRKVIRRFVDKAERLRKGLEKSWIGEVEETSSHAHLASYAYWIAAEVFCGEEGRGYWLKEAKAIEGRLKRLEERFKEEGGGAFLAEVAIEGLARWFGWLYLLGERVEKFAGKVLAWAKRRPDSILWGAGILVFAWWFHQQVRQGRGHWRIQVCRACGKFFPAQKNTRLTCSDYCRKMIQLAREGRLRKKVNNRPFARRARVD